MVMGMLSVCRLLKVCVCPRLWLEVGAGFDVGLLLPLTAASSELAI